MRVAEGELPAQHGGVVRLGQRRRVGQIGKQRRIAGRGEREEMMGGMLEPAQIRGNRRAIRRLQPIDERVPDPAGSQARR